MVWAWCDHRRRRVGGASKMMGMKKSSHGALLCWMVASVGMMAAGPKIPDLPWVQMKNGHLFYAEDPAHNRIPDFSTVGY